MWLPYAFVTGLSFPNESKPLEERVLSSRRKSAIWQGRAWREEEDRRRFGIESKSISSCCVQVGMGPLISSPTMDILTKQDWKAQYYSLHDHFPEVILLVTG